MPQDLNSIVQKMVDAGESEEDIASVIREFKNQEKAQQPITEPTTFGGGFMQSLTSGDALDAGMKGLKGYGTGAILNLPGAAVGALKTIAGMGMDPLNTYKDMAIGLMNAPGRIAETFSRAGSEPEAFGEMMGEITGQPLATTGLVRGVPPVARGVANNAYRAGPGLQSLGQFVAESQPVTGFMPPMATPRHFRVLERGAGRAIEDIGRRLEATRPMPRVSNIPRGPTITSERASPSSTALARQTPTPQGRRSISEPSSRLLEKMEVENRAPTPRREPRLLPSYVESRPMELGPAPHRMPASTLSRERFPKGRVYDRWSELIEKERRGGLTEAELREARDLDKKLRRADIEPIDVNTGEYIR